MESFQSSCHDYMMPTLNAIIRKDEKISTGACTVGFFGILSALIGLLGTAPPPPPRSAAHGMYIKNVNKKVGGSLKTEQQPAENEWKIVVE